MALIDYLPAVRGRYRENASLADTTWFRVGGCAEVLFKPADAEDLAEFIAMLPDDVPVMVLGVGSNIIVRDGGIDGVVVRLGRGFVEMECDGDMVVAGAANLDVNVAQFACGHGRSGLEFLSGVPGSIGGALAMNAGAYGSEIKDVLVKAEAISPEGTLVTLSVDECDYSYRHCGLGEGWIFTKAYFQTLRGEQSAILQRMDEIAQARESSQPIRSRTGGSTFQNPAGHKAWELIDAAGCRGMMLKGAQVSEKHCNFLINTGDASAADLEQLGDAVREKVKTHSGVSLEWEIKRIGKK